MTGAFPTIAASLARINRTIADSASARDRTMLEIYRDHWLAEVRNDVDAIMATLPDDGVSYRFEGANLFFAEPLSFTQTFQARQLYAGAAAMGLPMAGPFDEERWAFADWGMTFEGLLTAIMRGGSLHGCGPDIVPDALYLVRWRTVSIHPMDADRRLMLGEHVFTGSVVHRAPADHAMLQAMFGDYLVASAII